VKKFWVKKVYAKITDINQSVDIVDVFRPSKEVYEIAKDAVKIGAKVLMASTWYSG
jgi:predicted CoA-binding protein